MENPSQQLRRLRDQVIKTLNHPQFDASTDAEQQGFLREMTRLMAIDDDAMNALIRQSWNKRGPVPVLRPIPVQIAQFVSPAIVDSSSQTIRLSGTPVLHGPPAPRTSLNDVFKLNFRDVSPAELLRLALEAVQARIRPLTVLNDHFQREVAPGYHRIFIPQFTQFRMPGDVMDVYYVDPLQTDLTVRQTAFPAELQRPSIAIGQEPHDRIILVEDVPGYLKDIRAFLAYMDRLRQHSSIITNVDAQRGLTVIQEQIDAYISRATGSGRFNQREYITNMRGWRDQLTILSRDMEAERARNKPRIVPAATLMQGLSGQPPVTQNPVPGGLLPNFFQTFKVAPPVTGLAPSATANLANAGRPPQQPLSPTASRLAVPFTTFMTAPLPSQPTFVGQTELVYLTEGSKERKQLQKLRATVAQLVREERSQPANVRPSYNQNLSDLFNEITMYLGRFGSQGMTLYEYISDMQDFTDDLKDIQEKIAARPVPRYHPDLDPEILHRPAGLQQPRMQLGYRELSSLAAMTRVLGDIGQDELQRFGAQGVFVEDVEHMNDDLEAQARHYTRRAGQQIDTEEWLGVLRRWRDSIQELIDQRKALGRRCVNDNDPWDGTPVVEIPDNEYIRLSNGMCWHVGSLMEYIRGVEGVNDSKGLVGYASGRLWETDDDVKRIMEHPLVTADPDFKAYFTNVIYGRMADKISPQTLQMMYTTASLFVSRGQPFNELIKGYLTPDQYEIFMRYANGSAYKLKSIPANQQHEEIETAITLVMKGKAAVAFWDYYEALSQEEKEAIRSFRASFETDLRNCRFGKNNKANNKLCVYVMANVILPVVYRVADIKGLTFPKLNTSET